MVKSVYQYTSMNKGYHVGNAHYRNGQVGTFFWYNSKGLIDTMSEDRVNRPTITEIRMEAYNQLKRNNELRSIDIVHYGNREKRRVFSTEPTRYIADYVGTVTSLAYDGIEWVSAEGKWYKLNKDGSLGSIDKSRRWKETPRYLEV